MLGRGRGWGRGAKSSGSEEGHHGTHDLETKV